MQSSLADKILSETANKSKGDRLRAVEETIAYLTADKDRDIDEAVEQTIEECERGLDRNVS